jgi:hypothetical protein
VDRVIVLTGIAFGVMLSMYVKWLGLGSLQKCFTLELMVSALLETWK